MNTIIEKIRAEIERQREEIRHTDTGEMKVVGTPTQLEQGWLNALSWMEKVLDTLQEQPVKSPNNEDSDEIIKRSVEAIQKGNGCGYIKPIEQPVDLDDEVVRWIKEHSDVDGTYSGIEFAHHFYELGRQSKPEVCEDLKKRASEIYPNKEGDLCSLHSTLQRGGYIRGYQDCKEQMMKEAVEGYISATNEVSAVLALPKGDFKKGDKVNLLFVKKD